MNKKDVPTKKVMPNTKLRKARESHGWTQKDVATRIDLADIRTVSRWERGVSFPSAFYRQKLSTVFKLSLEELGLASSAQDQIELPVVAVEDNQRSEMLSRIPHFLTSFIGREQEVERLCGLLKQSNKHIITLFGAGGVGKTRLGLQVVTQVSDDFSDGVGFISLESISDPNLVLSTIAQELGIREHESIPLIKRVQYFLHDKEFLLFLDNFEHVLEAAPLIEDLIDPCPRLKVLITSRVALHLYDEDTFMVSPLPLPKSTQSLNPEDFMRYDSIALFVQRAKAVQPTFAMTRENVDTIVELCAHLDGLPLAIELAASRIKWLAPEALLARIRIPERLRILRNDVTTVPERQRTLYNTVKWSYDLLDQQDKWLFRHLSVFTGSVSLDTIEAFFDTGEHSELDIVNRVIVLLENSLLQCTDWGSVNPRFAMLETIRKYGLECLRKDGELEESQRSHAIFYLHIAEKAASYLTGPQQDIWLQQLEQDQTNLRAALEWLVTHKETGLALRFCEAFGKFCGLRGYWTEEQQWLRATLALPQTSESKAIRAKVLRRAGHLAYRFRDLTTARTLQEESVAISRDLADKQNLAGALSGLGWVLYRQNEITAAGHLLKESVEVARETGDAWTLANALESFGRYMHYQGDTKKAYASLKESLALSQKLLDKETTARILTTLVTIELSQGNIIQARGFAEESFKLAQELGTKPLIALTLSYLGDVALSQKAYDQAKQLFTESIVIARDLGDEPAMVKRQLKLVDVALSQDNLETVDAIIREILTHFHDWQNMPEVAAILQRYQHYAGEKKKWP
ncbi:hypothetical protein KSF_066650 [Reticulibacter mediterranei]|uniref:HTH cro/C1-type domain-containing protein n=1 Tax=Reticulibacter mediterranei TaxID=2778369 RepID=A0A8J3N6Z0_9CHLR|nr:tetratricopeptide repeat protein [Reticulibacter mediterranei]GHO96617.1 hypothetical protein KSF_066650 [Reticulibacter mediterranei]